jgi:hypothetical protein
MLLFDDIGERSHRSRPLGLAKAPRFAHGLAGDDVSDALEADQMAVIFQYLDASPCRFGVTNGIRPPLVNRG